MEICSVQYSGIICIVVYGGGGVNFLVFFIGLCVLFAGFCFFFPGISPEKPCGGLFIIVLYFVVVLYVIHLILYTSELSLVYWTTEITSFASPVGFLDRRGALGTPRDSAMC